jgi:hypothetical protein
MYTSDWIITILEAAKQARLTGHVNVDFRHGRVQLVKRTAMPFDPPAGIPRDAPEVLARWTRHGMTGHVDIYLVAGAIVDIQEAEVLFPPREPPTCPQLGCSRKLVRAGDYGNILECPRGHFSGTELDLRDRESVTDKMEG